MTHKQIFWRILFLLLLFSLIKIRKDVKNGFKDGVKDSWNKDNVTSVKK